MHRPLDVMLEAGARRLLDLLDGAVLAPRRGSRLLDQALEQAGLLQLPNGNPELRAFVRRSLRPILAEELGPRLADEVTGDLEAALSPALRGWATPPASPSSMRMNKDSVSIPPASMTPSVTPPSSIRGNGRKVLIVGRDRFGAASLARTLVGAGFEVTTAFEGDDLEGSLASGTFDAILCDELAADAFTTTLRGAVEQGAVLLVSHCRDVHETEERLRAGGIPKVFGLPSGALSRDIVLTLARCTA